MTTCSFHRTAEAKSESPTLIEGLPGHGLVASIAVGHLTQELDYSEYGGIRSEDVPPVLSFRDGRVQETVRVYTGTDPDVLTLEGDVVLPKEVHRSFSACVLQDLAEEVDRGIFLAAASASNESEHGEIMGVATNDQIESDLVDADISLADGEGLVGGVTGALVDECYQRDVPAALVLVRADPHVPDPEAARLVIDNALEPLIGFEIDTSDLSEQGKQIQERKAQIAQQMEDAQDASPPHQATQMYQ